MSSAQAVQLDVPAIAERYFAAWAARDPDAIVALHTEDTQFWTHAGGEPVRGREAVRQTFAEIFERFPGFGFDVHRVLVGADHWVLDWTLTWAAPDTRGEPRELGFDCLDAVVLSPEGLVARKDTFIDLVQLQAAIGGLEPATAVA